MSSSGGTKTDSNWGGILDATSSLVKGAGSFTSGFSQSAAYKMQGDYAKQTAELNIEIANAQAEDALTRGEKAVTQNNKKTKQVIGSQRASLASQGIDVSSGSALALQEDAAQLGALDSLTIKNNAWREAWGYKTEALTSRAQGNFASNYYRFAGNNTLLTGGLNTANDFLQGGYKISKLGFGNGSANNGSYRTLSGRAVE